MLILGLGSNIGDRLANLRRAFLALRQLPGLTIQQVSPIYISDALLPENAPSAWDLPYLNVALRCESTLEASPLLQALKTIEWSIGRKPEIRHWGPRIIDIDILAWDDKVISTDSLTVPHLSLLDRPFALWPLADVAPLWPFPLKGPYQGKTAAHIAEQWGMRSARTAPFHTQQIQQRIDAPQLVGIVNITPDSFSDGGRFLAAETALEHIKQLVQAGAEIIDIGAESTSPIARPLDAKTEWARLEPVLAAVQDAKPSLLLTPKISLDTRHSEVAIKALAYGIDWINDVSGLDDKAMREAVLGSEVDCVIMHHLSIPERREHCLPRDQDPIKRIHDWAESRLFELAQQGISRERIIFDPGIGFGKTAEQSLWVLKHAGVFKALGTRTLIGHSRKAFHTLFSSASITDRDIETMVITLSLAKHAIDYVRVHNVEMCSRGLKTAAAFQ